MSTLVTEREALALSVAFSEDLFTVQLDDGRSLAVPLAWYPRLFHGTVAERERYERIGNGEGLHWPGLDEDISVSGLLAGRASGESSASLARWLERRKARAS
jgi:hypothetical protein